MIIEWRARASVNSEVLQDPWDYALRASHISAIFIAKGVQHHPLFSHDTKGKQEADAYEAGYACNPV
jgi:hypothetical protein